MGQYTVILMKYSTWSGVPPRGRVGSVNVNPLGSPRPPALPSSFVVYLSGITSRWGIEYSTTGNGGGRVTVYVDSRDAAHGGTVSGGARPALRGNSLKKIKIKVKIKIKNRKKNRGF